MDATAAKVWGQGSAQAAFRLCKALVLTHAEPSQASQQPCTVQSLLRFTVQPFQAGSWAVRVVPFTASANGFKITAACQANEKIRIVMRAVPDKMGP